AIRAMDRVLDAEVEVGKHIGAAHAEHQKHLCRPAPDALDLDEVCNDGLVRHVAQAVEGLDPRPHLLREIAQIADHLARDPAGTPVTVSPSMPPFSVSNWRMSSSASVPSFAYPSTTAMGHAAISSDTPGLRFTSSRSYVKCTVTRYPCVLRYSIECLQ